MKFHSATTGGYYASEVHGANMPEDALPVSDADYAAIFDQPIGEIPPSMPTSVSPAQARLALLAAGKLDQVEAIVAAADQSTQIAWNNASVIERDSPTVAALAGALGLTDAQLDELFTTAAGIFV